ncbi:MAG: DNA double-strand break repair nuclease NurA [Euryarchaeota archaeon]|nr:DNA double-strand break repair nuclease NurA [Euryarchaeota archaeon]
MPFSVPALEEAAATILDEVPGDAAHGHPIEFHAVAPVEGSGRVAAVDGGSTVVLDIRTAGLYCVRAGYVLRDAGDTILDRTTSRAARTVTRRDLAGAWPSRVQQYGWGLDVPAPTFESTRLVPQLAEAERILAEYDAARRALHELRRGDLLLVDGCLGEEDRYEVLGASLEERAAEAGVRLAGLSKDSALSLGGVLPLSLELEEIAEKAGVKTPWWADVTEALGRGEEETRVLVARFDARSPAFRLDVVGAPGPVVARIAELCNDAAFPGYPYPLARVHARVHYESGEAVGLRHDLEAIVARRRGHRLSFRLFGKGRDVLQLVD